ncbi:MAG: class I SAM-dependent methyltransferase [Methanomassiliicoccaceae archaeon]|nr:class I SAM-dependent methyltransferase [Methanomassiliicoccaceae archaeon]
MKQVSREKVRTFWSKRAEILHELSCKDSQVTLENDPDLAAERTRTEAEVVNTRISLNKSDVVVDLGAGNGRFSFFFAPKVSKVIAVEYVEDFAVSVQRRAEEACIENIEVLNMPAEDFCRNDHADVIMASGLLHYLDSDQYDRIAVNISRTVKRGGTLLLYESVSILEDEYFIDKFSDELNADYTSLYRTPHQLVKTFSEHGFEIEEYAPFFAEGNALNRRLETRLYYFIFRRK